MIRWSGRGDRDAHTLGSAPADRLPDPDRPPTERRLGPFVGPGNVHAARGRRGAGGRAGDAPERGAPAVHRAGVGGPAGAGGRPRDPTTPSARSPSGRFSFPRWATRSTGGGSIRRRTRSRPAFIRPTCG